MSLSPIELCWVLSFCSTGLETEGRAIELNSLFKMRWRKFDGFSLGLVIFHFPISHFFPFSLHFINNKIRHFLYFSWFLWVFYDYCKSTRKRKRKIENKKENLRSKMTCEIFRNKIFWYSFRIRISMGRGSRRRGFRQICYSKLTLSVHLKYQ